MAARASPSELSATGHAVAARAHMQRHAGLARLGAIALPPNFTVLFGQCRGPVTPQFFTLLLSFNIPRPHKRVYPAASDMITLGPICALADLTLARCTRDPA